MNIVEKIMYLYYMRVKMLIDSILVYIILILTSVYLGWRFREEFYVIDELKDELNDNLNTIGSGLGLGITGKDYDEDGNHII